MPLEKLGKCISPDCKAEFKRMGTGKIYSLHVSEPQRWGMPAHTRQIVVWLCSSCAAKKRVRFDRNHCQVLVVSKHESNRDVA